MGFTHSLSTFLWGLQHTGQTQYDVRIAPTDPTDVTQLEQMARDLWNGELYNEDGLQYDSPQNEMSANKIFCGLVAEVGRNKINMGDIDGAIDWADEWLNVQWVDSDGLLHTSQPYKKYIIQMRDYAISLQ